MMNIKDAEYYWERLQEPIENLSPEQKDETRLLDAINTAVKLGECGCSVADWSNPAAISDLRQKGFKVEYHQDVLFINFNLA